MGENRSGGSFAAIVAVFFFWGFLAASNGIFIPFCKSHFQLSQFQSQLVDSAFYGAYFIGSLVLYIFSLQLRRDIINSVGYKKTIIYGLLVSVLGAAIMIPAVNSGSFSFILFAFFVIALGFSLQQTSANPLVLNIGDPSRGSHRLNFAGSVNSFGTTLGPILVSMVLFGKAVASAADRENAPITSINVLYVILGIAFLIACFILTRTKLPKLSIEEADKEMKLLRSPLLIITGFTFGIALIFFWFAFADREKEGEFFFLLCFAFFLLLIGGILLAQFFSIRSQGRVEQTAYPQVSWGMIAIFVYVGVEVTIQSNLGALLRLPEYGSYTAAEIGPFVSLYWGSLMIGRWTGSIGAFRMGSKLKSILTIVVPFCAFIVVLLLNRLNGASFSEFLDYSPCVAVLVIAFIVTRQKPAATLLLFSILGFVAMITGMLTTGRISTYAFLSGGLFCSIMWPCIFSLATAGLGKYTSQASAFLIMMILGGAFIPPLQGIIADRVSIHSSYSVTVLCFAFLAVYAIVVKRMLKRKGIDYDQGMSLEH